MRALRYSLHEALISLARAGRSTVMSVGTVAVAFVTLGGFLFVATNLQRLVDAWQSTAEMSIFLRDDVAERVRAQLEADLAAHATVARVEYISKDQALARFKSDFPELSDIAASDGGNPFPASLEIQLQPDPQSSAAADTLAAQLRDRAGVSDVRYDRQWLERLRRFVTGIRVAGIGIAGILVLGAAFTVAAVVRLSLFARRDEIEIMRLVGSPLAFIRGPSIAEGTVIGGLGAGLALLILFLLYRTFKFRANEALAAMAIGGELRFLGGIEATLLIVAALVVGGLTGTLVSRGVR